jgi:hypothetical protein
MKFALSFLFWTYFTDNSKDSSVPKVELLEKASEEGNRSCVECFPFTPRSQSRKLEISHPRPTFPRSQRSQHNQALTTTLSLDSLCSHPSATPGSITSPLHPFLHPITLWLGEFLSTAHSLSNDPLRAQFGAVLIRLS